MSVLVAPLLLVIASSVPYVDVLVAFMFMLFFSTMLLFPPKSSIACVPATPCPLEKSMSVAGASCIMILLDMMVLDAVFLIADVRMLLEISVIVLAVIMLLSLALIIA